MRITVHRAGSAAVLVAAATVVAFAAGCSGGEPPPPPSSPAPPPTTTVPAPTTTSASPTTTAPPPAAGPLPRAADGSNLGACRDGRCQVVVQAGTVLPVSPSFGITRFTIAEVTADSVRFDITTPGDNSLSTEESVGNTNTLQNIQVTVNGVSGNRAVVSLRPGG